jgi:protein TonB
MSNTQTDESTGVVTYPAGTENTDGVADTEQAADQQSQFETPEPAEAVVVERRPVAVSSLNRIRYVAPKYPRSAQRRNISGWVDVIFTVATDGSVKDVDVRNSEPGTTFVNAAVNAVEKWEFEPVFENGGVVERMAGVRMMFALE